MKTSINTRFMVYYSFQFADPSFPEMSIQSEQFSNMEMFALAMLEKIQSGYIVTKISGE